MKKLTGSRCIALAVVALAATSGAAQTPELRAGVSVQMPVTLNAIAVPDADSANSLVVAVARNGSTFLETTLVDPGALQEKLRSALAARPWKAVYVKGDARAQFATVANALESVALAGANPTVLLTDQREASDAGAGKYPIPPKGLEVRYGGTNAQSGGPVPEPIRVEAVNAGQGALALRIDNEQTSLASLPAAISQRLGSGRPAVVALEADGSLLFGDVVRVLDACRPTGAGLHLAVIAK